MIATKVTIARLYCEPHDEILNSYLAASGHDLQRKDKDGRGTCDIQLVTVDVEVE